MGTPNRNDSCPCGSGKKFKQCCGALNKDQATSHSLNPSISDVIKTEVGHHQAGRLLPQEAIYRQALQASPYQPEKMPPLGFGVIAHREEKNKIVVESVSKTIHTNPSSATYYNQGIAFKAQGKLDAAIESYRKALALKPDFVEAHINLGSALQTQDKLDAAIECYRKALSLRPDFAIGHNNLGVVLQIIGELEAAVESFQKTLLLKPDFAEAHLNLANAFKDQGKIDEALACYQKALSLKPAYADAYSNLLFLYSYHALLDPHAYLSLARGWEQACLTAQDRQAAHHRTFRRSPLAGRRLKVGYVSGDYRRHAVSCWLEQLFTHHDRARIELFAYSNHGQRDDVTERLQALVDHWVPIMGTTDAAARDRIEADGIDVLIDLSGHTSFNRLGVFARRAAPVQACYLGYFASTGLTEMDYWIGDEILTPPDMDNHFSEQIWRLPRVWIPYKTIDDAPEPDWHPASDGSVCVGSFNNLGKLTPQTLALWAKVLHALPEGRLLLKTKELADACNRNRILDTMASHGISPNRIDLQRDTDWVDYMAHFNRLDIALDPVGGHGGGVTTCDTLWMGVPVIHSLGDHVGSRFTASILNAIGHPEWIVRSEAEYVDKTVALARNVEYRKSLRFTQRDQMARSPLCDARDLAFNLENTYFEMYERWLEKQNRLSP